MALISLLRRTFLLSLCLSASLVWATNPRTLVIPVSFDSKGRYVVDVGMSSATLQRFKFALSTSTGYLVVAGSNCASCKAAGTPLYTMSSSARALRPNRQNVSVADASSIVGNVIKEDCLLVQRNSSVWRYNNQTVVVADTGNDFFSSQTSGVLGLGTNTHNGELADSVIGNFFTRNPRADSFAFGIALNAPNTNPSKAGVLHWLAPDPSSFVGQMVNKTVISDSSNNIDWMIVMESWHYISPGINQIRTDIRVTIDPAFPNLYFPLEAATGIYSTFPTSILQPDIVSYPPSRRWSVPCDAKMTLILTVGSISVTLKEDKLVIREADACFGAIQGWADDTRADYIFGGIFATSIYVTYMYRKNGPDQIGIGLRPDRSTLSAGALAGILVGSLVFVGVLALGVFYFFRRRALRGLNVTSPLLSFGFGVKSPNSAGPQDERFADVKVETLEPFTPFTPFTPSSAQYPLMIDSDALLPVDLSLPSPRSPRIPTAGSHESFPGSGSRKGNAITTPGSDTPVTVSFQRQQQNLGRDREFASSTLSSEATSATNPATPSPEEEAIQFEPVPSLALIEPFDVNDVGPRDNRPGPSEVPETDLFNGVPPPSFTEATGLRTSAAWKRKPLTSRTEKSA